MMMSNDGLRSCLGPGIIIIVVYYCLGDSVTVSLTTRLRLIPFIHIQLFYRGQLDLSGRSLAMRMLVSTPSVCVICGCLLIFLGGVYPV
jgi:hypothetical protein